MAETPLPRPILPPVVVTTGQATVIISGKLQIVSADPNVKIVRGD